MIPKTEKIQTDYEVEQENTLTHKIEIEKEVVFGKADGLEAVRQAVYIMLNVERYEWVIFSPNFGVEFNDLFGKPIPYCLSEIKRRVTECLLIDDRINDVKDFEFEVNKGVVTCTFNVIANVGSFAASKEVTIA